MTPTRPRFFVLARSLMLAALAVLVTERAHAAEPLASDAARSERHWYGWQSAIVDTAAVGLTLPLALRDEGMDLLVLAFIGPPTYAVGAPIVHFAHDQVPKGLASLGMRLGVPPVVGVVGSLGCGPDSRKACLVGIAIASMFGVMVLDDVVLAHEKAPAARASSPTAFRLYPTFSVDRHGATAGVGLTL